ncbi:rhodanese-like domain-containing protein [Natronobacterium texcoconense]|uniref:Rhodanese-related sulfurtransferase n=1 Tax=Natronobacterium texcoconense TaxID=1095778 RepID=A0A1H1HTV6_NATTX|nr:rhodanese-like domain-containing protein [Natronobacterium texcoconense]SDR28860.1 Rhodanese-related sulfurtransferase [Natronobacterium texcoconense]
MNRRQFLATGTFAVAGLAGCLGGDAPDGYGPEPEDVPPEREIDTAAYDTETFGGVEVPLAPLEDVVYWYRRQEARMVDTRESDQYRDVRITGAVLSSAPDGGADDPVAEWSEDDLIVTYCVCPHLLAGQRAATLIANGYENVYALDEGLQAWVESGHPVEGSEASQNLPAYTVQGRTDPEHAGEFVHVRTLEEDRSEVSAVESDGSYELTLHFAGLEDDSLLEVEAPDYTRELTLEEATNGVVTA